MDIIEKILGREEFADNPPVLIDIGASGAINPKWRRIAPYSICIAFDADEREMGYTVKESSGYKKLYVYNKIVTDIQTDESDFYLTCSPYCSSLLRPKQESLDKWAFAELFEVEKKVRIKTITLPTVLKEIGISKIDWFKTDSQGTDLRLFNSLGEEGINRVLVAEFEPGIIDAYEGEDKLWRLMATMEEYPFWMADIAIGGSQRISKEILNGDFGRIEKKIVPLLLKTSPAWGEVTYFNTFQEDAVYLDKRDFLLGWVFAIIEGQYGFALEIAMGGYRRFNDPIFKELEEYAHNRIRYLYFKLPLFVAKKIAGKLVRLMG